jgi:hypothetical protein
VTCEEWELAASINNGKNEYLDEIVLIILVLNQIGI